MRIFSGLILLLAVMAVSAETISVTTLPLEQVWQKRKQDAPASVVSLNAPRISAELDAVVVSIPVKVGDIVNRGDVLIELDCQSFEYQLKINNAELQRSNAQLNFARSQLSRAKNLQTTKSISDELLDQRKTELLVAQADQRTWQQRLSLAQIDVSHCQVKSPFKAVITERLISEGAYANKGLALIALTDLDDVEVKVRLRQAEIASLKQASAIWLDSQQQQFPLTLRSVLPVFDEQTATAESRLVFSTEQMAWPGAVGRLEWQAETPFLPASYVVRREGELGVFYVDGQTARFHLLPDAIEGRPAEISLAASTPVVVEGRQRLQDGDQVEIKTIAQRSNP